MIQYIKCNTQCNTIYKKHIIIRYNITMQHESWNARQHKIIIISQYETIYNMQHKYYNAIQYRITQL